LVLEKILKKAVKWLNNLTRFQFKSNIKLKALFKFSTLWFLFNGLKFSNYHWLLYHAVSSRMEYQFDFHGSLQ
jgi:hypothetical protein